MKRNSVLVISAFILIILAIIIIILGFNTGPKVLLPPIITGIGFLVIGWGFASLREK